MEKVTSVELCQSLDAVLKRLARTGRPIILEQNNKPAAVLISVDAYRDHFAVDDAEQIRTEVIELIKAARLRTPNGMSTLDLLREVRGRRA